METSVSENKHAAIAEYLTGRIENHGIEHQRDFNLSAHSFKVQTPNDSLLLKVSDEFIDDHQIDDILKQMDKWGLVAFLTKNSDRMVFVGNDGVQFLARS